MAASKLLQKHLFIGSLGLQPQAYRDTFPSFFFVKKYNENKKKFIAQWALVKAQQHQPKHWTQSILNKQSQLFQKCWMSKQENEREKTHFLTVSYNHQV